MAIENILINVSDVARSADFYTRLLGGSLVGEATTDSAVLGFRHVGFKVADVDSLAVELEGSAESLPQLAAGRAVFADANDCTFTVGR